MVIETRAEKARRLAALTAEAILSDVVIPDDVPTRPVSRAPSEHDISQGGVEEPVASTDVHCAKGSGSKEESEHFWSFFIFNFK